MQPGPRFYTEDLKAFKRVTQTTSTINPINHQAKNVGPPEVSYLKQKSVNQRLGSTTAIISQAPVDPKENFLNIALSPKRRNEKADNFKSSVNFIKEGSTFGQPTPAKKIMAPKVRELVGSNTAIAHNPQPQSSFIKDGRLKSLTGCYGSSGMMDSLSNPFSNNKSLTKTDKQIKPYEIRETLTGPRKVWNAKPKVDWVQPKGQKLTLQ